MRLLMLLRITTSVPDKQWQQLRQMVLHAYGFKFLSAFSALEDVVREYSAITPPVMSALRKRCTLAVPEDAAAQQVLFGIHPLTTHLIAGLVAATDARAVADLTAATFDSEKRAGFSFRETATRSGATARAQRPRGGKETTANDDDDDDNDGGGGGGGGGGVVDAVVCFVGGVTCAELTSLRRHIRDKGMGRVLFVTTDVITGNQLAAALNDPF